MFSFYFPFFKLSFPLFVIRLVRDEEVVNAMSKKGERFDGVVCVLGVDVLQWAWCTVWALGVYVGVWRERNAHRIVDGRRESPSRGDQGIVSVADFELFEFLFLFLCSSLCSFFPKTDLNFCSALGSDLSIVFLFFFFLGCQFYSLFFMGYLRIVHTFSKRVNKNTGK